MSSEQETLDSDSPGENSGAGENSAAGENTATPEKPSRPPLKLSVVVDNTSACERHIMVTVSADDMTRLFAEELDETHQKAQIPGFRVGKAPRKLVEGKFRKAVADQVKAKLLMEAMTQVTEEHKLSPISEPKFDFQNLPVPAEGEYTFEYDLEVRPEFTLPQWRGLTMERPVHEITEEDLRRKWRATLAKHGTLAPSAEPAAPEDHVTVNLTVAHLGQEVRKLTELDLRVASSLSFPDGVVADFAGLMTGAKAGDIRETNVEITYHCENENLRGETVTLRFEVLDVKRLEMPTLTERILAQFEAANEDELRAKVRAALERQIEFFRTEQVRRQISNLLLRHADWELPRDLVDRQASREEGRLTMELQSSGFARDEIQDVLNQQRRDIVASTAAKLKEHFILERIAEEEKVEASDDDLEAEIGRIAERSEQSRRAVKAQIERHGSMDLLRNQVVERKVLKMITDAATFVDKPVDLERPANEAVNEPLGGKRKVSIPEAKHADEATPPGQAPVKRETK